MPNSTCYYPTGEGEPPEGFDEWRPASGLCEHEGCRESAEIELMVDAMSADEIAAIRSDRELVADEYGGMFR
jgi:hypothetical protein